MYKINVILSCVDTPKIDHLILLSEYYLINYNDDAEHDFVYVSEPNLSHAYNYLIQPHYLL